METTPATLEILAARLAEMGAAHAERIATLEAELAALRATPERPAAPEASRKRRAPARVGRTPESGRTSRRGLLGTAAKVAAATVAAGVVAEQVATRPALAASNGVFSSSVSATPAVAATGTSGAVGVTASSDTSDAIVGTSAGASSNGVKGVNNFDNWDAVGVLGHADVGMGVKGETVTGYGVYATATTGGVGVYASAEDSLVDPGTGVRASGSFGVFATSNTGTGVWGTGPNYGIYGASTSSYGTAMYGSQLGNSATGIAVLGHSDDGHGRMGPGIGVQGETASGIGVHGIADTGIAVYGDSGLNSGTGVKARTGVGYGVFATATTGIGVYATSGGGSATEAVLGIGTNGTTGLRGGSDSGNGMVAASASGTGLNASSGTGSAIIASSGGVAYGLYLSAPSGWAIGCAGRLRILGNSVGTVTLAHGTTSKAVYTNACSASSNVLLTAQSDPQVRIWVTTVAGQFTIHASGIPSKDVTFTYLLVN